MKMKYMSRIQSNLKQCRTIRARKATTRVLDGSYRSVYKGRSMNFDELREYVPGDDIKDMDWKASARSRKLLMRQYVAEKKHNLMLVMDTNCRMLADTETGQEKREVALLSAGTLAYLISRNGDYVGAMFETAASKQYFPCKTGLMNVEHILCHYDKEVTPDNKSDFNSVLQYILKNIRSHMLLILVTDMEGVRSLTDMMLRRLLVMHDVLILTVSDMEMSGDRCFAVENNSYLPAFLSEDRKLLLRQQKRRNEIKEVCTEKLKKYGIAWVTIHQQDEIEEKLVELLNKHKLEKR